MDNRIILKTEDGKEAVFYAEEQTRVGGISYLLVSDDEQNAYILKDISDDIEEDARYILVEDDEEVAAVSAIFDSMLDDIDLLR